MPREIFLDYENMGIVGEIPPILTIIPPTPKPEIPMVMDSFEFSEQLAARKSRNNLEIDEIRQRDAIDSARRKFLEQENQELAKLTVQVLSNKFRGTKWVMPTQWSEP